MRLRPGTRAAWDLIEGRGTAAERRAAARLYLALLRLTAVREPLHSTAAFPLILLVLCVGGVVAAGVGCAYALSAISTLSTSRMPSAAAGIFSLSTALKTVAGMTLALMGIASALEPKLRCLLLTLFKNSVEELGDAVRRFDRVISGYEPVQCFDGNVLRRGMERRDWRWWTDHLRMIDGRLPPLATVEPLVRYRILPDDDRGA
jgi:hypothetical protein